MCLCKDFLQMFIGAFLVITPNWNQPKYLPTDKQIVIYPINLKIKPTILPAKTGYLRIAENCNSRTIGISREQRRGTLLYRVRRAISKQEVHWSKLEVSHIVSSRWLGCGEAEGGSLLHAGWESSLSSMTAVFSDGL